MAPESRPQGWAGPSRRRVPRFRMQVPLDITVLRSGIPDKVPGRAMNVCERGMAAVLAGELLRGESVGVEVRLSQASQPLRMRAVVRYQDKLSCGLEFVSLTAEQRTAIRDWAKQTKAGTEASERFLALLEAAEKKEAQALKGKAARSGQWKRQLGAVLSMSGVLIAAAAGVFWWKWNHGWEQIEAGLRNSESTSGESPQVQVPAEVMQKLLVHRVEPVYPAEARKQNVQGIIALDIVIARDGSVSSMKPLNGPNVLARAAMDALRWWKFEPYRLNGEPAAVETTVAVEFKR
jgi:TonB family protein